jgi:hypothetical protein
VNNTLKYVKILESTGITREQSEVHVQIISDVLEGDLATKQDLKNLETKSDTSFERIEQKIKNLEGKLETSVERIEHKMLQSEYRITIKLGSIVTIAIAAATAVIKLI